MVDPFAPGGALARELPDYEHRPQQSFMAQQVADTLNTGGVALIEAGTGTGKSLAYLIPAARAVITSGRPIVIATHTINLQEQLIHKDIPPVSHIFSARMSSCPMAWTKHGVDQMAQIRVMHANGHCIREEYLKRNPARSLRPSERWIQDCSPKHSDREVAFATDEGEYSRFARSPQHVDLGFAGFDNHRLSLSACLVPHEIQPSRCRVFSAFFVVTKT